MTSRLLMPVVVFVTLLMIIIRETRASLAKPGCQKKCGNVTIPYPFGIGTGCYLDKSFEVLCSGSSQDHYPLRFANNHGFQILEFSRDFVRVLDDKSTINCTASIINTRTMRVGLVLDQYFFFAQDRNLFVATGCNILGMFFEDDYGNAKYGSCESICVQLMPFAKTASSCNGFNGCCKLSIPKNITSYKSAIYLKHIEVSCSYAFIVEKDAPIISFLERQVPHPVVLHWVVATTTCHEASKTGDMLCGNNSYCIDSTNGRGYNCHCKQGYTGNPYLPNGCQDQQRNITEYCPKHSNHYCEEGETCVYTHGSYKCTSPCRHTTNVTVIIVEANIGLSAFGVIGYLTYIVLVKIRTNKMKKKFFRKNGGHLLKQHISANKPCVMTIIVYTAKEMEKATEKFVGSRIVGKGGHGTVYKGLLRDGTIVAIKKSNVIDADQVERFVNEVCILSQINHRNIVKLLGCCLEYEVPLLVYEYLANDTLSQHLHDRAGLSTFSWKDRIRIIKEVAGALAYLHSYASPAIFHRDIKPDNILLDQNYKAVVSDFGLSRLVPLSKSHLTTQVEGTLGYLDPEYFQSGKLTAKSDVYSFGVVLTELLTSKKPIFSSDSGEGLVPKFKHLVKHNRFIEILDDQVVQEAMMDDLVLITKLAKRCMKTNSKKRPTMEEVVTDLDNLKTIQLELLHKCIIEQNSHDMSNECYIVY